MAATLLVLAGPSHVSANGPEVGRDVGMVFPVATDSVQLWSEQVTVNLPPRPGESGHVTCHYYLRNLARSTQSFDMAFVTNRPLDSSAPTPRRHYADADFQVFRDGVPVSVRYARVAPGRWSELVADVPDSLPVWHIDLEPDTHTRLRMDYEVEWSGGSEGDRSTTALTYHARPAALWAGVIAEAEVRFTMDRIAARALECSPPEGPCFSYLIAPTGYKWNEDGFGWTFQNWEPSTDFRFSYWTDGHDEDGRWR